ncbi:hypothetical protein [Telmatospirillum sp. J64-1]|uniref:hypothetical protein n=1 Tax=Telmatospirillum sp. J64-1 TaxID=2502183 RepID=UPI00115E71DC|nr:hypothetical protein [Telmatospirillum sp. J64-1]
MVNLSPYLGESSDETPTAPPPRRESAALALLRQFLASLRSTKPAAPAQAATLSVLVCPLNNDVEGQAATSIAATLAGFEGFSVRQGGKALSVSNVRELSALAAAAMNARHLAAEERADVLVWGDVINDGESAILRFAAPALPEDDRPAPFTPATCLDLPGELSDPLKQMLFATILTAAEPQDEARRQRQRELLPPLAQAVTPLVQRPPMDLNMAQQRSLLTCYGHISALMSLIEPKGDWIDRAVTVFGAAVKRMGRQDPPVDGQMLEKSTASALMAKADRSKQPNHYEDAIAAYRRVLENLPRTAMPAEWAAMQNRLGLALYRLDLQTGRTELLKEAFVAFQSALQVHTRAESPQRWAEVMHNLALALEVYGDQMKSPDVLEKAIEACRLVAEVRSRESNPVAWAAVMNTLGSALFLLDKHSKGSEHLDEAADALRQAAEIYTALGARRPAAVAQRNLAHVERLLESRREREQKIPDPHWAFIEDEHEAPPSLPPAEEQTAPAAALDAEGIPLPRVKGKFGHDEGA